MACEQRITKLHDDFGEEHVYCIVQLPTRKGFKVFCQLVSMLSGALGRSMGAITPANVASKVNELASMMDTDLNGAAFGAAFERLAMQIAEDDALLMTLFANVARDGKDLSKLPELDMAFAGNYGEMMFAIREVLLANYAPFFSRVLGELGRRGVLEKLKAKAAEGSKTSSAAA